MIEIPDIELLRQFAQTQSETAFAALVQRHIGLVHSVALRHTTDPDDAQDITQAVFIILAKKAVHLSNKTILPGWLYHAAQLTAANFQRAKTSRLHREQEAFMCSTEEETDHEVWQELSPLLDEAMARLGTTDRNALILRYFQNKTLPEVGTALGMQERAAQKRVARALEKLRKFFTKRGLTLSTSLVAGAVSANSIQAAPVALANTIAAVAVTKGVAAGSSTLTLVKGALKIMAWTKAKMAVVAGISALLAGTTVVTVEKIHEHRNDWQLQEITDTSLDSPPYITKILPTKAAQRKNGKKRFGETISNDRTGQVLGFDRTEEDILRMAYTTNGSFKSCRTILHLPALGQRFDFISSQPQGAREALQLEIKRKFRMVGQLQTIETNVFFLKVKTPDAAGLKPAKSTSPRTMSWSSGLALFDHDMKAFSEMLEGASPGIPIIDQTGLTNHFDFKLEWADDNKSGQTSSTPDFSRLRLAMTEQLGLELVPGIAPVEMLVFKRAK